MSTRPRIYIAGHRGMVGSALLRKLSAIDAGEIVTRTREDLDLTDQAAVKAFFASEKISKVITISCDDECRNTCRELGICLLGSLVPMPQ